MDELSAITADLVLEAAAQVPITVVPPRVFLLLKRLAVSL